VSDVDGDADGDADVDADACFLDAVAILFLDLKIKN
jgi:hypothetical protein